MLRETLRLTRCVEGSEALLVGLSRSPAFLTARLDISAVILHLIS